MQMRLTPHLLAALIAAFGVSACSSDIVAPGASVESIRYGKSVNPGLTVTPSEASVVAGSTLQLQAANPDQKAKGITMLWSSSNSLIATVSATGLVTGIAPGGPVVITASTGGKKPVTGLATITVVSPMPTWTSLVSDETAPSGAIFQVTNAPSDNAVYAILGDGDYQPFALWRLDLTNDTWSLVPTTNIPLGKYRLIIHNPVTHQIHTYWDGRGQVYAVAETGGSWQAIGSTGNSDEYYQASAFWNTQSNTLMAFGGYGFNSWKNTLVGFESTTATWNDIAQSAVRPGQRSAAVSAVDETAKVFYLGAAEGPSGTSSVDGRNLYNDLWRLDMTTNTWAQLIAQDGSPGLTTGAGMDMVPSRNSVFRFGGATGYLSRTYLNALQAADVGAATPAWTAVSAAGAAPSPRFLPGVFYDAPRTRLVIVGGYLQGGGAKLDAYALSLP